MAKVKFVFDPFELVKVSPRKLSDDQKSEALSRVADLIQEKILSDASDGISSVYGSRWAGLSSEYKKQKVKEGGRGVANLELFGDYLSGLIVRPKGNKIEVTFEESQQGKADGHNNFSGDSKLPLRRSIPNESDGETFRRGILNEVEDVLADVISEGEE